MIVFFSEGRGDLKARYLVRFDDICPAMNWQVWESVESILKEYNIKPILAVIPDNQDPQLVVDAPRSDFWNRVRQWQNAGWAIALHGYQHRCCTDQRGLFGLQNKSEFAGLAYEEQRQKLEAAVAIMHKENVQVDAWIAPCHSFDFNTVRALSSLGIDVINDGYFTRPLRWMNARWIPQQLWRFRPMPAGLWTVCYHHNAWSEKDLKRFEDDIRRYQSQISSLSEVLNTAAFDSISFRDRIFALLWWIALKYRTRSA